MNRSSGFIKIWFSAPVFFLAGGLLCGLAQDSGWRATADLTLPQASQTAPYVPQDAPAWFTGLWIDGGGLSPAGWAAADPAADRLVFGIDRGLVTNDLALTVTFSGAATGAVHLCDASLAALTTNLAVRSGEPAALPFGSQEGAVYAVFTVSPSAAVRAASLSVDLDVDGLDAGEEAEHGTSDASADSDGDGYTDLYEILCGTDPLAPSSHPSASILLAVPGDVAVEAPGGIAPETTGFAAAWGNGFTPAVGWSDSAYPDLRDGLLAAFRLDGDGPLQYGIGSLCLTGRVRGVTAPVQGRAGGALSFDGRSGYVALGLPPGLTVPPGAAAEPRGAFSMSAWIRPASGSGYQTIVAQGLRYSPNVELSLRINNGKYEFRALRESASTAASHIIPAGDFGQWVHLAGVCDGQTWILYRNGVEAARLASAQKPPISDAPWAIGAAGHGDERFFKGDIDEVGLWSRALSAGEVARIWRAGTAGVGFGSLAGGADRVWTASQVPGQPGVSATQSIWMAVRVKTVSLLFSFT
jgi:hypothetical protein